MSREYGWFAIQRVKWDVIVLPDGSEECVPSGQGQARVLVYNNARSAAGDDARARLSSRHTWEGELFLPTGREKLDIQPRQWRYGYPIEDVTPTLNRLAREGWEVMHVSEDRGLYLGADTHSDAWITKARYLLVRDAG